MNERQMLASGKEMSSLYWSKGHEYRKENPDGKKIGDLGVLQGLNSGVTLMDFGKVRKNKEATNMDLFNPYNIAKMAEYFKFIGELADQDWYVLFSWYYTDNFYMLPCNFNYQ